MKDQNDMDPEATIRVVSDEGYNLSKLREDTWQGEPAYVVGADKGDLNSKQFWITKDSLLFVRIIEPARDATKTNDIRFTITVRWPAHGSRLESKSIRTGRKYSPRIIRTSAPT